MLLLLLVMLLQVLEAAVATRKANIMEVTLDLINKLIAYRWAAGGALVIQQRWEQLQGQEQHCQQQRECCRAANPPSMLASSSSRAAVQGLGVVPPRPGSTAVQSSEQPQWGCQR
jgi:hypothetical protein